MKSILNFDSFHIFESKKSQQKFFKDVDKLLIKYGSVKEESEHKVSYDVSSKKYGKYTVTLFNSDIDSKLYSVFGRFEDVKLVKDDPKFDFFDLNKYSGKCNFHNSDSVYVLKSLEDLLKIIKD
jgi:hypothetical protein